MHCLRRLSLIITALCLFSPFAYGQVSVLTHHNDNGRTGQNLKETTLTTSNVNVSNFGLVFSQAVDGFIYAQPLVASGLSIGSKGRVVYVATEHNSVYAIDADNGAVLWHDGPTSGNAVLGTSVPSNDICNPPLAGCPYTDLEPEIGITATPVIDLSSSTIYVVAKTKDTSNNTYHFKLHALDLITGAEKFGGPVEIATTGFNPFYQNNRPGLLLLNGYIYIGFASVGDYYTWHGWVLSYNASSLGPGPVFNSTPGSGAIGGGIWAGDQGLAADTDNVYVITSNGTFDWNTGGSDYASSFLKLSTSSGLKVVDFFAPDNQSFLNGSNADLGSGGPVLLPGTTLLVGGGKDGMLRVVDTSNMQKFNPTFNNNVQNFQATNPYPNGMIMGSPVYWGVPNFGPYLLYIWGPNDVVKAFQFNGQTFQTTPVMQGTTTSPVGISNEAAMSISTNAPQGGGSLAGTGILWAAGPTSGDANLQEQPGILHAYDASNLAHELWNSNQNPARDNLGNYAKFSPPTIANGKVYIGNFSNPSMLMVYGLNPPPASGIKFIQVAAATPQKLSSAAVTVTPPSPQIPSDLNVVVVGWNDTTSSVQSVTDSFGNTYSLVGAGPVRGTGLSQSIYYAKNIASGSGLNTISVTFNQVPSYPDIRVLEYAGADPIAPLDVNAVAGMSGSSTTSNSGSLTTTGPNELLVAGNTVVTWTKGAGTGFAKRIITSPDSDIAEDRIAPSAGAYSATASLGSTGAWVMQMAAFKQKGAISNPAPAVTSISPTSGSTGGGTGVTISGSNFVSGATVSLGGTAATNVAFVNSSTLTVTTPAHAAGAVNVVVTNPDAQSGTLNNGFTYLSPNPAPTVSSVSPPSGPTGGGTGVTISGSNFASGAAVSFGGTAASSITVVNSTTITATTPSHTVATVNVVVTNSDGQSGTLTNGYTYTSTSGSIAFVQGSANYAAPQTPTQTLNVPYTNLQTAGDLNIVVVGWNDTTSTISSVTDSAGNTYTQAIPTIRGVGLSQSIYFAPNIKDGSNKVIVTFNQPASYADVRVLEYTGLNTATPLDGSHGASGNSATANSGPVSTTSATELIFGADTVYTGNKTPGSGFTVRIITSPDSDLAEDETVSTTGSYSATATLTASGNWVMQVVTFKQ